MDAESGQMIPGGVAFGGVASGSSWQLDAPFFIRPEKPLQEWVVDPESTPPTRSDSESEEVLLGVDPNEVFKRTPLADPMSETDSGVSEETTVEKPVNSVTAVTTATSQPPPATVYQVVYDVSTVGGAKSEPGQENMISIELDWSSQLLFSDSCVVSELPVVQSSHQDGRQTASPAPVRDQVLYSKLRLTEEEQKLLTEEGVSLPNNLPLTKAEDRILKKVRRKIRNKQSAQDSRRRRKEYIDGLESRAAACSAQNKELQRRVEQLEKHNTSLLAQLQQLQALIKQTVSKGAQTSTCLLIIVLSLGLIILPSFSLYSRRAADDDYRPTGVISRNILTEPSLSSRDDPASRSDSTPPPEPNQSEPLDVLQQPMESSAAGDTPPAENQSGNLTAAAAETEASAHKRHSDPTKPEHADEM